ncbi:hypothetical protein F4809DRAFT_652207 [Biscogniauxia mediterranea]|nr:hypothetical protein F4809DRAFT_652207 [Biscogniauxia mediterranea]
MFRVTEALYPNAIRRQLSRTRPFATIVSVDGTCQDLSYAQLENVTNRAAWFLDRYLPQDEKVFYMGPNDIRYLIWVLAAMKTGKCVLCPSPSNPIPANTHLFETVGASKLMYAPEAADSLSPLIRATRDIVTVFATPNYEDLMSKDLVQVYPFEGTFDELKHTNFMGLHTSGTSGHPKPLYWNHMAASTLASCCDPSIQANGQNNRNLAVELFVGQNVLDPFPLYHLGGMAPALSAIHYDNTVIIPAPGTRLTPENMTALLKYGKCTSLFSPPSVLEAMSTYPAGVEALSKLQKVAYTGGPLNPTRGKELAKYVRHLFPILASTEGGPCHLVSSGESSHWNAFKFMDFGQRMEETTPGFYELVFPRTELINNAYAFFQTCPDKTEYRTSDLFCPVEGQDGWWTFSGRVDNWVIMSNGLKMDPTDIENTIAAHPDVMGVLVAGSRRFRLCMLLEMKSPPTNHTERENMLERLWPTIDKANKAAPKFGRVPRELITFTTKEKPFMRASKGTIQRRLTILAYEKEIEEMYNQAQEGLLTYGLPPLKSTNLQDLIPFLIDVYAETLDKDGDDIGPEDDLFSLGLDSLSSSILSARLKAGLRNYGVESEKLDLINNKLLYSATTIRRMAEALAALVAGNGNFDEIVSSTSYEEMEKLVAKFENQLPRPPNKEQRIPGGSEQTIILTGSTGSLGSYMLASLLTRADIKKIYCLNRSEDAKAKQEKSLSSRGLPALPVQDGRVVFLQAKLSEPNLGLPADQHAALAREATCIIHNAFPVNFLLSVQSFEPQVQALVNLLHLAAAGARRPSVLFVSSIAAALPVTGSKGAGPATTVPEAVLGAEAARGLLQQGYAQAKHVCERLLEKYAGESGGGGGATAGPAAAVLRVGQICGPVSGRGVWNVREWAPSLVVSSKFLGVAPDSLGGLEINWIPVDELGRIVAELVAATGRDAGRGFAVYNVVNPTVTPWRELLSTIKSVAPATVTPREWIATLEASDNGTHVVSENPALKLVDFYRQTMLGEPRPTQVHMENLLSGSETARALSPIKGEHMARWMKAWGL